MGYFSCRTALLSLAASLALAAGDVDATAPTCGVGGGRACAAADADAQEHVNLLQQAAARPAAAAPGPAVARRAAGGLIQGAQSEQPRRAGQTQQPVMKDVLAAFNALRDDDVGNPIYVHAGSKFPKGYSQGHMPYSEHFQGVARAQGSNVLFLTGSGTTTHVGQLFALQVGSRPAEGALALNAASGAVPPQDVLVDMEEVDKTYDHCGGMSVWGDYAVFGCEAGCSPFARVMNQCKAVSTVHFYDVSDPTSPRRLPYTVERPAATAGASALVQEADGKFLLLVGGPDSKVLDFYRSASSSLASDPHFAYVNSWKRESLRASPSFGERPSFGEYQNINLVRQTDGRLFMFGTYRTLKGMGMDYVDLFQLDVGAFGGISVAQLGSRRLFSPEANFYAAGGVYIASPDKLMVYGANWEPTEGRDRLFTLDEFQAGGCQRDTGGKCGFFPCSSWRGRTVCTDGRCLCQPGTCSSDGKCG